MTVDDLYSNKDDDYYSKIRHELVRFIPKGLNTCLEIGCGNGATLAEIKRQQRATEVFGLELSEEVAKRKLPTVDRVLPGNFETNNFDFDGVLFDYVIFCDVLEHFVDPWEALKKTKNLLKPGGKVISLIPNIRHWKALGPLLTKGEWEYKEWGLLDKGHLRFFTKSSIYSLFEAAGFEVLGVNPVISKHSKSDLGNRLTLKVFENFLTPHYVVEAEIK